MNLDHSMSGPHTGLFSVSVSLYYCYFWCRCGWRASRLPYGCASLFPHFSRLKSCHDPTSTSSTGEWNMEPLEVAWRPINGICGRAVVLDWAAPHSNPIRSAWNLVACSQWWQVRSTIGIMYSAVDGRTVIVPLATAFEIQRGIAITELNYNFEWSTLRFQITVSISTIREPSFWINNFSIIRGTSHSRTF